jgi:hypothetical protein
MEERNNLYDICNGEFPQGVLKNRKNPSAKKGRIVKIELYSTK